MPSHFVFRADWGISRGVLFFDVFDGERLWVAVVGVLQVGLSSPQMIEPVEGDESATSIAFFVAASIAKSLPLYFPTLRTWFA